MNLSTRVYNFFNDLDKGLNTLGGGKPNQTISGTLGRGLVAHKWWAYALVPVVNFFAYLIAHQADHCQNAAIEEAKS